MESITKGLVLVGVEKRAEAVEGSLRKEHRLVAGSFLFPASFQSALQ